MNCINHPDRPAVRQCTSCLRSFCEECSSSFVGNLCPDCAKQVSNDNRQYNKSYYRRKIIWIVIGFCLGMSCLNGTVDFLQDYVPTFVAEIIYVICALGVGGSLPLSQRLADGIENAAARNGIVTYPVIIRWVFIIIVFIFLTVLILPGFIYSIRILVRSFK